MRIYAFKIELLNGQAAYADTGQIAQRILADYLGQGQIIEGEFTVSPPCICEGIYRNSTAPVDLTGHLNSE